VWYYSQRTSSTDLCDNPVSEVSDIAIAISTPFDKLHSVVDTLHCSIGDPLIEIVENMLPPTLQCLDEWHQLVTTKLFHPFDSV